MLGATPASLATLRMVALIPEAAMLTGSVGCAPGIPPGPRLMSFLSLPIALGKGWLAATTFNKVQKGRAGLRALFFTVRAPSAVPLEQLTHSLAVAGGGKIPAGATANAKPFTQIPHQTRTRAGNDRGTSIVRPRSRPQPF